MDLNEKMAAELASQLGLSGSRNVNPGVVKQLEKKSDEELIRDIKRLKEQLAANNISSAQMISIVRKLMPMMDANQKARLQRVIELLR